jgi:hypothetical protein
MSDNPNLHDEALAAQTLLRAMRSSEDHDEGDEEIVVASETNLREAIELALLANAEDEAHVEGLAKIIEVFAARAGRKDARIDRRKGAILAAMEIAGLQKLDLAAGTVSVGKGQRKVIITDQELIPDIYIQERTMDVPNKKAIKEALVAKQPVPGAELSNAMPTLTVRVR